jgi:hypothetical protein
MTFFLVTQIAVTFELLQPEHRCTRCQRTPNQPHTIDLPKQHFLNFLPLPQGHGSLRPS